MRSPTLSARKLWFAIFTIVMLLVIGIGGAIIVKAVGPQPGDMMILMALPLVVYALFGLGLLFYVTAAIVRPRTTHAVLGTTAIISALAFIALGYLVEFGTLFPVPHDFEFRNHSSKTVWVDDVAGIKYPPPCGILGPGASKTSLFPHNEISKRLKIRWWYDGEDKTAAKEADLSIEHIDEAHRSTKLVFEFGTDYAWKASFEPNN